jgi:large subunit ribosomal protein L1
VIVRFCPDAWKNGMGYQSVRYRKQLSVAGEQRTPLAIDDGIAKIKEMAAVKSDRSYKNGRKRKDLDQTVEIVLHLGIDPRQADQMLRGAISLPKGIGKARRVIAFCDGPMADAAKQAGAVEAGAEELVEKIQGGWLDFDVAVAHPSMMGKVGKLGRVLGPQGKMPTPKAGTVTPDVETAVREFAAGRIEFRNDDGGNIHLPVGKVSFSVEDLRENVQAVIDHMVKMKPAAAKGQYLKRVSLTATRTPSVAITPGV